MARHVLIMSYEGLRQKIMDAALRSITLGIQFEGVAGGFSGAGVALIGGDVAAYSDIVTLSEGMTQGQALASLPYIEKVIVGVVNDDKPWLVLMQTGQAVQGKSRYLRQALELREQAHRQAMQPLSTVIRSFGPEPTQ